MADRFAMGAFVEAVLENAPDAERDVAACELVSAAAGHLTALVGGRESSALLYSLADLAATPSNG